MVFLKYNDLIAADLNRKIHDLFPGILNMRFGLWFILRGMNLHFT